MDGAHDMGGVPWSSPVQAEPNEPTFHAEWERRAFAITLAMGRPGGWNFDMERFAREDWPPEDYLSRSYYATWSSAMKLPPAGHCIRPSRSREFSRPKASPRSYTGPGRASARRTAPPVTRWAIACAPR